MNRETLFAELSKRLADRGSDEWFAILSETGVPAGPINDIGQAFDMAKRLGLDVTVEIPGGRRTSGCQPDTDVDHAAAVSPAAASAQRR